MHTTRPQSVHCGRHFLILMFIYLFTIYYKTCNYRGRVKVSTRTRDAPSFRLLRSLKSATRAVEEMKRLNGRQNNWSDLLPMAEFLHNSWKHESSKYSPHELITGCVPSAKLTPLSDTVSSAQQRIMELTKARSNAQQSLQKHITHVREPRTLEPNQQVWLDARNLRIKAPSKKLAPRRYRPFKIVEKISKVDYRISLPRSWKIHNVFHIDRLIPFIETEEYGQAYSQPTPELIDGEEEYEVDEIITHRRKGRSRKQEYLVKWKGYPSSENSWMKEDDLHAPELLAEYRCSLA